MPCSEWENLISEYIDGELSPADRARVEQHMLECESCAQFFMAAKADGDAIAAAFDVPRADLDRFADRVMAGIEPRAVRRRTRWPWAIAAAAASIIIAVLASPQAGIGRVATITDPAGDAVTGGVQIVHNNVAGDAEAGSVIRAGDSLYTAPGRVVFIRLKTGDEIAVNCDSSVTLAGKDRDRRGAVALCKGEVFVRAAQGRKDFTVLTGAAVATVLGTEFSVAFDREAIRTALTVVEGAVRFHNSLGEKLVTGGHRSVASAGGAPSQPEAVDARALTAWVDPPSAARLEQVARGLADSLTAALNPSKDVYEAGEPIYVTVTLTNSGSETVQFSRAIFLDKEDTAARRRHYKLSQIMLTRIFGSELEVHSAELPAPDLGELKPGQTWRARLDLTETAEFPFLRAIRGPGAYSVSVAFAAAGRLPGAPDDSLVWADIDSESAIVRVVGPGTPREGRPVKGLQIGLSATTPGCTLGDALSLRFTLKGVTSDEVAVSTAGDFRLKVEPLTSGMLTAEAAASDLPGKLEKTLGELGIEDRELSLRRALDLLPRVCGISVLADRSAVKDETIETDPTETLSESLARLCAEAGTAMAAGRSALWFVSAADASTVGLTGSLAKLESEQGWVRLRGVDSKDGELKLTTGAGQFPHPGLYRCTVEYSNRHKTKSGPDWPAAWLGSVRSNAMIVAVLAPRPTGRREDNGLSLRIRQIAGKPEGTPGPGKKHTLLLSVQLRNTSEKPIVVRPRDAMKLTAEWLLFDALAPE